jgi:hypothetical protein
MFSPTDYRDELHAAIATALGMSLVELEAAFAKGHTVQSLAELQGSDLNKVRAAVREVHRTRIRRAADEGDLSREQAEQLLQEMDLSDMPYAFGERRSSSTAEPKPKKPRLVAHRI